MTKTVKVVVLTRVLDVLKRVSVEERTTVLSLLLRMLEMVVTVTAVQTTGFVVTALVV